MKKALLFVALMFAVGTASAEWVLRTGNNGGGEILLTNKQTGCNNGELTAVTRLPNGATFGGCYWYDDSYIYVRWNSGDFRTYDWKGWTINPKFETKKQGTSL